MNQYVFTFDVSRCSGCMACTVACQDQNDSIAESSAYRRVTAREEGSGNDCHISFISMSCLHCESAPCLMACPTCAISKDLAGMVSSNRDLCIGCHSCELACPFGAPKFAADGKMAKCDFCHDRVEAGLKPACVRVCPTRALDFGTQHEVTERKAKNAALKILKAL